MMRGLGASRRGYGLLRIFGFCFGLGVTLSAIAASPDEIRSLAEVSPRLAFQALEQAQPPYSVDQLQTWQEYERLRLDLYARQRNWRGLLARVQQQAAGRDPETAQWLVTRRLRAQIELGEAEAALKEIRALLWANPPAPATLQLRLRQLVVLAYLALRQYDAGGTAAQRYHQDYAASPPLGEGGDTALHADSAAQHGGMRGLWMRALIHAGNYAAAASLADDSSAEVKLLGALARLLGKPDSAAEGGTLAAELEAQFPAQHPQGRAARVLLARAANRLNKPLAALQAQAGALAVAEPPPDDELFALNADDLWTAYESYGRQLATERGLERGYAQPWLAAIEDRRQNEPLTALALATAVLLDARERSARDQAAARIFEALQTREQGARLALVLFMQGQRISHADLPPPQRFELARLALSLGDQAAAATLFRSLAERPAPISAVDWEFAQAHSALLAGSADAFKQQLMQLAPVQLESAQTTQLRRLLRDAGRFDHAQAAAEFCERWLTSPLYPDVQPQRSLLLLELAHAQFILKKFPAAATSAWRAQSGLAGAERQATLRLAGQALLQAGMQDDARRVYDLLLSLKPETTAELLEELRAVGLASAKP
ncbi:MAG: hypothetical protein ACRETN_10740 [Nevskiales bacterium]